MSKINVPQRNEVNEQNQQIFDQLEKNLGMVPNLYATLAHSDNALASYLALQNSKTSLTGKEREIVNLVVSEVNDCEYCLAAHTMIAGSVGFNKNEILEIRSGTAKFDRKLDALAKFTKAVASERGKINPLAVDAFLSAGYTKENLVDVIVNIGDKTVTNYLHSVTQVPVDFPVAEKLRA